MKKFKKNVTVVGCGATTLLVLQILVAIAVCTTEIDSIVVNFAHAFSFAIASAVAAIANEKIEPAEEDRVSELIVCVSMTIIFMVVIYTVWHP